MNKEPIFIPFNHEIVRIDFGHAKAYSQPIVQIISPAITNEETGAFTPAQSIDLYGIASFEKLIVALQTVVNEYNEALKKEREANSD